MNGIFYCKNEDGEWTPFNGISEASLDCSHNTESQDKNLIIPNICAQEEISLSIEDYYINKRLFEISHLIEGSVFYTEKVVIVQRRTHKKKRINKKWLKRYGFREKIIRVKYKIITMKRCGEDGKYLYECEPIK